jgi:16S rRNA processing protein RimM
VSECRGDDRLIVIGRISGLYGVAGWVRVFSETEPREGIVGYTPWLVGRRGRWEVREVEGGHRLGKGVVAKLAGFDDRDSAAELLGAEVAVRRDQLPSPAPGSYYWADLEGLEVLTVEGVSLGRIERLFATASNDVMVVKADREHLVPFIREQVVKRVDLGAGVIEVDWDPEF